jgi:hypothetical protein
MSPLRGADRNPRRNGRRLSFEQTIIQLMELTRRHPAKTAAVGAVVTVLPVAVAKIIELRSGTDLSTVVHLDAECLSLVAARDHHPVVVGQHHHRLVAQLGLEETDSRSI